MARYYRNIIGLLVIGLYMSGSAQITDNYVTTWQYLDNTGDSSRARVSTTYFDGLGRERQRVELGAGGAGENLFWRTEYDRRGNIWRRWLPVPSRNSVIADKEFSSAAKATYGNDEIPYTSLEYENGGTNRQTAEIGPGLAWQKHGNSISWHKNELEGKYSCVMLIAKKDGTVKAHGVYKPKTLSITETTDPNGIRMLEFTNMAGKVVMRRTIGTDGTVADTRFIYDGRNDLRCALSPEGSLLLPTSGEVDETVLCDYGQRFDYDLWHRCISTKAPGCGAVQYVYNKMDAVCFESTAEQRSRAEWTVTKFDSQRRLAVKGLATIRGATRESLQNQHGDSLMQETYVHDFDNVETRLMYTNNCGPNSFKPYMAWYYDNYDFIVFANDSIKQKLETSLTDGYTQRGLCTGTAMHPNNSSDTWISAVKYDHRGLPTHRYKWDIFLQQYRHSTVNSYDFVGNLTLCNEVVEKMAEQIAMERHTAVTQFQYDKNGRPVKSQIKIDENPQIQLSTIAYDAIGRPATETGAVTTDFSYDIRSNLTGIVSDCFAQQAWFGSSPNQNAIINYTGINALSSSWYDGQDAAGYYSRTETFAYDALGRYKSSTSDDGKISEEVCADLDANITEIKRKYNGDVVQNAFLQYDGGKNTGVLDCSTPYWTDKLGRFPAGDYDITYDSDGRIKSDETRAVKSISYLPFANLPYQINMENGDYTSNTYFPDGSLFGRRHTTRTIRTTIKITADGDTIIRTIPGSTTTTKTYLGNFERVGSRYIYYTPQGYYDLSKKQHFWYQRDRQGSTVAVCDAAGRILQTTAYYPSGTPFQLPNSAIGSSVDAATDQLHIGNRWLSHSGMNYYDNTARFHDPLLMHFITPDNLYTKYPGLSPWSHCAANPLCFIDVSGNDWYRDNNFNVIWTDYDSQEELDKNEIKGIYLGKAHVVFEGSRDERLGYKLGGQNYIDGEDAVTARVIVYGPKNKYDIHYLTGYTMSSDHNRYTAIDEGLYPANYNYIGKNPPLASNWVLNYGGRIRTLDGHENKNDPSNYDKTINEGFKTGVYIHSTNPTGFAGYRTSVGCLLLLPKDFDKFNVIMKGVKNFTVQVSRWLDTEFGSDGTITRRLKME